MSIWIRIWLALGATSTALAFAGAFNPLAAYSFLVTASLFVGSAVVGCIILEHRKERLDD